MESVQPEVDLEKHDTLKKASANVDELINNIKTIVEKEPDTFLEKLKNQLKDMGKTLMATVLALIVAVVSSFIFNSQYFQEVQVIFDDIRSKLPTEADKILVQQLSSTLGENSSLLDKLQQEQFRQKEKALAGGILNTTLKLQLEEASKQFATINENNTHQIELLSAEIAKFRASSLNKSRPINRALITTLKQLQQRGEALSSKKLLEKNVQIWLKRVYYFVHTLPSSDGEQQLAEIKNAMTKITESKSEYQDIGLRVSETLIIISTLKSLAEAAVLGTY